MYTGAVMTKEELNLIKIERKEGSTVVFTGEVPYAYLEKYRAHAVEHVGHDIELPGFRKGHVPENILIAHIGEMALINDMAEHALEDAYRELIKEHGLDVVGYPQVNITKLAKDNPLGFTITVAIMPTFPLPDYMKIASDINKGKESNEVTDAEVTKQIEDILRQKVAYERLQAKAKQKADTEAKKKELGGAIELPTPDTVTEKEEAEEIDLEKMPLPELTDDYVKTFGQPGQFESVQQFKEKIKEHLAIEKARDVDSRHRAKITDAIIEKTVIDLPQVMIDAEINQMFAQMEEDLTRAQLKMDDYLAHVQKTRDDMKNEWTPNATKRAKLQLVLNAIAQKDGIVPDASIVDHEVSNLLEKYKDADEHRVRVYVSSVLTNDAVMKKLEEAA